MKGRSLGSSPSLSSKDPPAKASFMFQGQYSGISVVGCVFVRWVSTHRDSMGSATWSYSVCRTGSQETCRLGSMVLKHKIVIAKFTELNWPQSHNPTTLSTHFLWLNVPATIALLLQNDVVTNLPWSWLPCSPFHILGYFTQTVKSWEWDLDKAFSQPQPIVCMCYVETVDEYRFEVQQLGLGK